MDLSPTAARMLDTLPTYYSENAIVQRILQGYAAEVDLIDATLDALKDDFVPTAATDDFQMLAVWEMTFGLPVAPAGVSVMQRQQVVKAALRLLNTTTATDVLGMLDAVAGPAAYSIARDTPVALEDTMTINAPENSFAAIALQRVAAKTWPAHRLLSFAFAARFVLDLSLLDTDEL